MEDKITLFIPTKNRSHKIEDILKNISIVCDDSEIFIANCSDGLELERTSNVIRNYQQFLTIREFLYEKDPGVATCCNDMFKKIETKYSMIWTDDEFFLREFKSLYRFFEDPKIQMVALPMIDDITYAPSIKVGWPKDEFGCALWMTPTGRCAHHSILRTEFFKQFDSIFTKEENIDNFLHSHTTKEQRIWPTDGAYIYHLRVDDDTRKNYLVEEGFLRSEKK